MDPELLDDLKTSVSEACNNVVVHAYGGELGPLVVDLEIKPGRVGVIVQDWGGGIQHVGLSDERTGVGLAVISALADRAEFISSPGGGTEVRMVFTGRGAAIKPPSRPAESGEATDLSARLSGDVIVTLSAGLLSGVLGRVARAVAAGTHFSLDRFSDVYLVTDAIASFAETAASGAAITFAAAAGNRRLELTLGPFRAGRCERLRDEGLSNRPGSPLALLVDELAVDRVDGFEMLRVVVVEDRDGSRVESIEVP